MGARLEAERAHAAVAELEAALDRARGGRPPRGALAAAAAALDRRERDVAERLRLALEREAATEAFRATRRFRLATALARPADLARRPRRRSR